MRNGGGGDGGGGGLQYVTSWHGYIGKHQ